MAMLLDLLKEFLLELLRALFIEDMCQRVKGSFVERSRRRRSRRHWALLRRLRIRQRERLLHKLTTDIERKL